MWRIQLLGGFGCRRANGDEAHIQGKKARGVLAYLALAPNKTAMREDVAARFWSLSGEQQARQSLRQCLSALRKQLDDGDHALLRSEGDQLSLDAARIDVDVDRVLGALDAGDERALSGAAEVVRGGLLSHTVFGEEPADDWLRDERHRILTACQRLLFRCAESAENPVDAYERILHLDPACEEAHRGLMQHHANSGRRSAALAQFRACEDALARHLDAQVSEATGALYEKLRLASEEAPNEPARAATLPLPDKPSVAVLAFDNLCGDASRVYLCDGFSEDITTSLAQFSSLCVIARDSAFAMRGKGLTIPEIGRQLGVHYVLQGSVQAAGNQLRVSAQLVDAEQGSLVWSQRYDGTMRDVFAFRDDIAQRIVATVAGRIEADALARAKRKATDDLDVYEYVLRGKYHHHRCTVEDSKIAVDLFQKAVDKRADYTLAHGWLACAIARHKSFSMSRADKVNSDDYLALLRSKAEEMEAAAGVDTDDSECLRRWLSRSRAAPRPLLGAQLTSETWYGVKADTGA